MQFYDFSKLPPGWSITTVTVDGRDYRAVVKPGAPPLVWTGDPRIVYSGFVRPVTDRAVIREYIGALDPCVLFDVEKLRDGFRADIIHDRPVLVRDGMAWEIETDTVLAFNAQTRLEVVRSCTAGEFAEAARKALEACRKADTRRYAPERMTDGFRFDEKGRVYLPGFLRLDLATGRRYSKDGTEEPTYLPRDNYYLKRCRAQARKALNVDVLASQKGCLPERDEDAAGTFVVLGREDGPVFVSVDTEAGTYATYGELGGNGRQIDADLDKLIPFITALRQHGYAREAE
jgi:hypothetical protein